MKIIILLLLNSFFSAFALFGQQFEMVHDIRDNKIYRTVIIGNLAWMAENLNFETDTGSWCYDESNANCQKYGRLYTYEAAQTACMVGWRLPSKNDFDTLLTLAAEGENLLKLLKEGGAVGFNALPGGWRGEYSGSYFLGEQARFWSSGTKNTLNAWFLSLNFTVNHAEMQYESRKLGLSVRCVKDQR